MFRLIQRVSTFIVCFAIILPLALPSPSAVAFQDPDPPVGLPDTAERMISYGAIDGDSIKAVPYQVAVPFNLIGIFAPTGDDCYADEALAQLDSLVKQQVVYLETDESDRDDLNQRVRYLWIDVNGEAVLVNELLVREGFAIADSTPPNTAYEDELKQAQAVAQENGAGLWGACNAPPVRPDESEFADPRQYSSPDGWSLAYDGAIWTINDLPQWSNNESFIRIHVSDQQYDDPQTCWDDVAANLDSRLVYAEPYTDDSGEALAGSDDDVVYAAHVMLYPDGKLVLYAECRLAPSLGGSLLILHYTQERDFAAEIRSRELLLAGLTYGQDVDSDDDANADDDSDAVATTEPANEDSNLVTFTGSDGWSVTYDKTIWSIFTRDDNFLTITSGSSMLFFSSSHGGDASECAVVPDQISDIAPASWYVVLGPYPDDHVVNEPGHVSIALSLQTNRTQEPATWYLDCQNLDQVGGVLRSEHTVVPPEDYEGEVAKREAVLATIDTNVANAHPSPGGTDGKDTRVGLPFFQQSADKELSKDEVCAVTADPEQTASLLDDWNWTGTSYQLFQGSGAANTGGVTDVEVEIYTFSSDSYASKALNYFVEDRMSRGSFDKIKVDKIGDRIVGLQGDSIMRTFEYPHTEVTLFMRIGATMVRITAAGSFEGGPTLAIAQSVAKDVVG